MYHYFGHVLVRQSALCSISNWLRILSLMTSNTDAPCARVTHFHARELEESHVMDNEFL